MNRILALGTGLIVLSAGLLGMPLNTDGAAQRSNGAEASSEALADAYRAAPLTDYDTTTSRPLFTKERRKGSAPTIEDAGEPEDLPPQELDAVLLGVMENKGEVRALIAPASNDKAKWMTVGEQITGWAVDRIDPDQVVLTNAGESQNLFLYNHNGNQNVLIPVLRAEDSPVTGEESTENPDASDGQ